MLIKRPQLEAIVRGEITLAFRRQRRPTVKAGGTLKTALGVLAIDEVDKVSMQSITAAQAKKAGYASKAELIDLLKTTEGSVYRIALRYQGEDPRIALRKKAKLSAAEREEIANKLAGYDKRSKSGAWTKKVLRSIQKKPGTFSGDLAAALGYEKAWFKGNVRKLKALGLTESLEVGYRLSLRGKAFLKA